LAKGLGDNPLERKHQGEETPEQFSGVYFNVSNPIEPKTAPLPPVNGSGVLGKLKRIFGGK